MEPDVTQHLSCEVMHGMMKLWATCSYVYSVFGGWLEMCFLWEVVWIQLMDKMHI